MKNWDSMDWKVLTATMSAAAPAILASTGAYQAGKKLIALGAGAVEEARILKLAADTMAPAPLSPGRKAQKRDPMGRFA